MKHDVSFRFAPGRDMFLTMDDLRRGVDCPSKMTCLSMRLGIRRTVGKMIGKSLLQVLGVLRHCSNRRSSECRSC